MVVGSEGRVTDIDSEVDFDRGTSWMGYTYDSRPVRMEFVQGADWLDPDAAERIIPDFHDVPDRTRLYIVGGQSGIYV